jgi:hypothetical protein
MIARMRTFSATTRCPTPLLSRTLLLLVLSASVVRAESLADLLAGVAENARFTSTARADVDIECVSGCRPARAVLLGRGDALYVETKAGLRALVRPGGVSTTGDGPQGPAAGDPRLEDTVVLLQDLEVFVASSLKTPLISDDGPTGVVVTGAPATSSPYSLLVYTIDRERRVVVKTQYYRGAINNLVKIRRDGGWVNVDGHWRPSEVTVESIVDGAQTRLRLAWRGAPDAPAALFEPAGLQKPSNLSWP